jgi:hypothetical protein
MPSPCKMVVERRRRVIDSLLEVLTSPTSEIETSDIDHFVLFSHYFGVLEVLEKVLDGKADNAEIRTEMEIGCICYLLNKLVKAPEAKEVPPRGADTAEE